MVKITPTISLYYSNNKPFNRLVVAYKLTHILFGLDFGFIEIELWGIKKLQKALAVVQCIVGILLNIFSYNSKNPNPLHLWWYFMAIAQYVVYVIILILIKKENTVSNLFQDIKAIDIGLRVNHASFNLEIKLFCTLVICVAYQLLVSFRYYYLQNSLFNSILHVSVLATIDLVRVTYAFMFYVIYCRLKVITLLLKEKQSGFLSIQYLYRSIVDVAEQHKNAFDFVVCMN